ncbi:MAG TPA: PAC2 family protein [Aeromicrobium sp.]|nr:PAC2 family protein [Aeromicrobium sp.]
MKWPSQRNPQPGDESQDSSPFEQGPALIYAFDGFLTAGAAPRLAADELLSGHGEVVHSFEVDKYIDYRARRPLIGFSRDHYHDYLTPRLDVVLERDAAGIPYFVLAGPEPDYAWETFTDELQDVIQSHGVTIAISLGAVPMGVPHTRPPVITTHATRPELIDRVNMWAPELQVPSSAQALIEYRLGQRGIDAAGYVVHIPHYVAQVEYPPGAVALLDAIVDRTGLQLDYEQLKAAQATTMADISAQIAEQDSADVLSGLEEQYDAFARGAAESLLAEENAIPTGDELADQFERYLARQNKKNDG